MDGFTGLLGLLAGLCAFAATSVVLWIDAREPTTDDHAR